MALSIYENLNCVHYNIGLTISVDWTIKESARAKIRTVVKRLLRKYGYPPDMELLATELVLNQAEIIAEELVQDK